MTRKLSIRRRATGAVALLLVAGCGSEDDGDGDADAAETPAVESIAAVAPADDPLALADGESVTFEVTVVVAESNSESVPAAGTVLWDPNCYTLAADGTFDDPVFPNVDAPVLGTWETLWDGSEAGYLAEADASPLVLTQTGTVTVDGTSGTLELVADSTVSVDGAPVVRVTSTGEAVEKCSPEPG